MVQKLNKDNESGLILGRCEIRKVLPAAREWLKDNSFSYHFMTADDFASRLELDADSNSNKAKANFGNIERTKELLNLFDGMHWKYAEEVMTWG